MIGQETVAAAKKWCEVGARWIENGAVRLGLNYIDRAIAVFAEADEPRWLTYAKHQKLDGLKETGREEDAEAMFDEVMKGYTEQDDAYGKALLLAHLADVVARQGRSERALVTLNLAASIAEAEGLNHMLAYALAQQARILMERENLIKVIHLFRRAEGLLEEEGLELEAMRLRFSAAEAMVRLGERADAIALLEDLQTRLIRALRFREALEPLNLLGKLYEESDSWDEKNRISQLVHLCGQNIVRGEGERRRRDGALPLIRPVDAES
jgi:tetratricopeptide (TPR) repeat protein